MNIAQRFSSMLAACLMLLMVGCASDRRAGQYVDDTVITSKVKAAFAADPTVKATEVQVDTYKGTVQLSGFVGSRESAQRAVQIARDVEGVKEVRNNTVVK